MCKQQWVNCFRKNHSKWKQFVIATNDGDDTYQYIIRMLNDRDSKLYDDFCLNVFKLFVAS